jgi:hypothetical protein
LFKQKKGGGVKNLKNPLVVCSNRNPKHKRI